MLSAPLQPEARSRVLVLTSRTQETELNTLLAEYFRFALHSTENAETTDVKLRALIRKYDVLVVVGDEAWRKVVAVTDHHVLGAYVTTGGRVLKLVNVASMLVQMLHPHKIANHINYSAGYALEREAVGVP